MGQTTPLRYLAYITKLGNENAASERHLTSTQSPPDLERITCSSKSPSLSPFLASLRPKTKTRPILSLSKPILSKPILSLSRHTRSLRGLGIPTANPRHLTAQRVRSILRMGTLPARTPTTLPWPRFPSPPPSSAVAQSIPVSETNIIFQISKERQPGTYIER